MQMGHSAGCIGQSEHCSKHGDRMYGRVSPAAAEADRRSARRNAVCDTPMEERIGGSRRTKADLLSVPSDKGAII